MGEEGLDFKCFTVNVKNEVDEAFLNLLESDIFRSGLKLVSTAQPAIALFSEMGLALTKSIASRNRNVPVQNFCLGLDFSDISTRARLAQGSYIVAQIPNDKQRIWRWDRWVYDRTSGYIVEKKDPQKPMPYNYIVFSISLY